MSVSDQYKHSISIWAGLCYIQVFVSSSYNPKSSAVKKIPPIDEHNFAMWKSKAMVVIETIDFDLLNIVDNGPHVPMYRPMVSNAPSGPMKQNSKTS